ncbi:(2Fe-2S)-binding protein [Celerinatantimonas diazotrophica]|uniref:Bacterioferritin-associated ferredoxin n=1 Tax=Celerinatantimonas diazotrophica TaxID=412034 RepID=A0A4V2PND3_9GAMM|nr:(2Fe-2S)-binding protein [Celerinatantimonas diazotrophica]TCK46631.1 bacterioferritin-associated ferredoxin [Celerinatantimonas diazotrophica]CAG9295333.1 Bacterioferritin-associated ferredoxin [Celerinatantimonas diazotrophica]
MFVCICQGVTDSQIRQAVNEGKTSLAQIQQHLHVAQHCGRCTQATKTIIRQEIEKLAQQADFYEVA